MEASYNRSGRCVCTFAGPERLLQTHHLHGDLDHEPVVLAQVEARELADPASWAGVRVDVERLGGRADGAAAAQELLQRPEQRGRPLPVVIGDRATALRCASRTPPSKGMRSRYL